MFDSKSDSAAGFLFPADFAVGGDYIGSEIINFDNFANHPDFRYFKIEIFNNFYSIVYCIVFDTADNTMLITPKNRFPSESCFGWFHADEFLGNFLKFFKTKHSDYLIFDKSNDVDGYYQYNYKYNELEVYNIVNSTVKMVNRIIFKDYEQANLFFNIIKSFILKHKI